MSATTDDQHRSADGVLHDPPSSAQAVAPFVRATAVTSSGDGAYVAELDPRYAFGDKINGGYLLAIAARAVTQHLGDGDGDGHDGGAGRTPRPVSAVAHYGSAPAPGAVTVRVEVRRQGRTSSQAHVGVVQGRRQVLDALFTLRHADDSVPTATATKGSVTTGSGWSQDVPVELPPERECFLMPVRPPGAPVEVPIMGMIEQRLDPRCLGFATGSPTGRGELRGWVRIPGLDPIDTAGLLLVADALPPAVFDLGGTGWVPTLSLNAHLLAVPSAGPLRVRQQVRATRDGLVTQVCDIWDAADALVVHATQLAVADVTGATPRSA